MAVAQADAEFRARYSGVIDTLRAEHPRWIRDARTLHLPSHVPPWTDTGIELAAGEWFTALERRARCPGRTRVISVQGPAITSGVGSGTGRSSGSALTPRRSPPGSADAFRSTSTTARGRPPTAPLRRPMPSTT